MFAYCNNNPVCSADHNGKWLTFVIGAIVGVGTQMLSDALTGSSSSVVDYASAAISGALAASGLSAAGSVIANAVLGGATYLAICSVNVEDANAFDFTMSVFIGGVSGAIGGSGSNGTRLTGVLRTAADVFDTAVSPKKIAMYSSKIIKGMNTIVESTTRTVAAGLFSNTANSERMKLTSSPV